MAGRCEVSRHVCLAGLDRPRPRGDEKLSLAVFHVCRSAADGVCMGCAPGEQVARWLSPGSDAGSSPVFKWLAVSRRHRGRVPARALVLRHRGARDRLGGRSLGRRAERAGAGGHPARLPGPVHGRGADVPGSAVGRAGRDRQGRERPRPLARARRAFGRELCGCRGPDAVRARHVRAVRGRRRPRRPAEPVRPGRRDLHRGGDAVRRRRGLRAPRPG